MSVEAIVGLVSGLGGVVLGAMLAAALSSREARIERTLEMHREFESTDLIGARYRASELLAAHPGKDFTELRRELGRAALEDVWTVTAFYQRLSLAIQHRAVDGRYVAALFGDTFLWWCDNAFRVQLFPLRSERADALKRLEAWMLRHATPSEVERWRSANELVPMIDTPAVPSGRQVAAGTEAPAG